MKSTTESYGEFGDHLSKALRKRNMTQVALAEKIGVDKTHVNKWVNNRVRPSTDYLKKIADVMGFEINELITGGFKDEILYRKPKINRKAGDETIQSNELSLVESYVNAIIETESFSEKVQLKGKLMNILKGLLM